jgi:hypothetical protein
MGAKSPLSRAAVFVLILCASDLLAQKEFDEAHEKIAAFWSETSNPKKDPAQKAKVAKDFNELTGQLRPLIDAGILSYLNSSRSISPEELTIKIAKGLAYPYESVDRLADADGNVSVVPLPNSNGYAIAYDIATCASCTTSWVKIAARRDNHWVVTDQLDNPEKDNAVHLAWVGSEAEPLLALYGVHWWDAHNRLDVRLYSLENGIKEVWSSTDLFEGEIAIEGSRMKLTYWTAPRPPYQIKTQVFEVKGWHIAAQKAALSRIQP